MVDDKSSCAVTGAFGYTGKYIARKLIETGKRVITLTDSLNRPNPFGHQVPAYPFNFGNPEKLIETLRGVSVLYNTYWVRFNHKLFKHADAVENTKILFHAAKKAGVKRIVHVSITNPSEDSHLEYFRGKAILERALKESRLSYTILRPTVIFGKEDILINNIAWILRKLPVFGIFGDGRYRLQPIYVGDLARIAVESSETDENQIIDTIGPETYTFRGLVETIAAAIGKSRPIVSISPSMGSYIGRTLGKILNDVLITPEEIEGLMSELLYVDSKPAGKTSFSDWAKRNGRWLGRQYASELDRRRSHLNRAFPI